MEVWCGIEMRTSATLETSVCMSTKTRLTARSNSLLSVQHRPGEGVMKVVVSEYWFKMRMIECVYTTCIILPVKVRTPS